MASSAAFCILLSASISATFSHEHSYNALPTNRAATNDASLQDEMFGVKLVKQTVAKIDNYCKVFLLIPLKTSTEDFPFDGGHLNYFWFLTQLAHH